MTLRRLAMVPLTGVLVWAALTVAAPAVMSRYPAFTVSQGVGSCRPTSQAAFSDPDPCAVDLEDVYRAPIANVVAEAATRSLALLAGAALVSATVGVLLGLLIAALRRRSVASALVVGASALIAAVPSFFVVFLLQMGVIFIGNRIGHRFLPVYGFGWDEHLILPIAVITIPTLAATVQLVGARASEVLDADFVTTARAKGLLTSWILRVHVQPHVVPIVIEAIATGLRTSVASLPIVEYLLAWNGIGLLALQSIAAKDAHGLALSGAVIASLFALVSLLAERRLR